MARGDQNLGTLELPDNVDECLKFAYTKPETRLIAIRHRKAEVEILPPQQNLLELAALTGTMLFTQQWRSASCHAVSRHWIVRKSKLNKTNSVALSPQENYTD
jgi:hypothetical protein